MQCSIKTRLKIQKGTELYFSTAWYRGKSGCHWLMRGVLTDETEFTEPLDGWKGSSRLPLYSPYTHIPIKTHTQWATDTQGAFVRLSPWDEPFLASSLITAITVTAWEKVNSTLAYLHTHAHRWRKARHHISFHLDFGAQKLTRKMWQKLIKALPQMI